MTAVRGQARRFSDTPRGVHVDQPLVLAALALLAIGIVMVGSTSVAVAEKYQVGEWYFLARHVLFVLLGLGLAVAVQWLDTRWLEPAGRGFLFASLLLLALVLMPGLGVTVNGATRWLNFGLFRFQVVEAVKLLMILYVAGYLARRPDLARAGLMETLKPLLVGGLVAAILLKQPDMGSAVVLMVIVAGMVWLAGATWKHLSLLGLAALPLATFAALEPYRLARLTSFGDPFADPYDSGFQLVQALIAVGRGEVAGVGLGGSVQKLFYLPEAHTDFIFAILAEELGLIGIVLVLGLFALMVVRVFRIGIRAQIAGRGFAAFACYGIGLWIGLQALVSMGVNLGVLPTKGLTLPLVSAGGSSILMLLLALGLVVRIGRELDRAELSRPRRHREMGFVDMFGDRRVAAPNGARQGARREV
ncbi:MAG: putative lipid II flippase FtsW [Wenzhouxiangellaceae bacterium]|nr:putative lipid II flippase FtsW [Wenzhouxiangellaceae bacterium]